MAPVLHLYKLLLQTSRRLRIHLSSKIGKLTCVSRGFKHGDVVCIQTDCTCHLILPEEILSDVDHATLL